MNVIGFWKPKDAYGEFSNWYKAEFDYDGKHFINSEQAFMYLKAKLFNDFEIMEKILKNGNPMICKNLGRCVKSFDPSIFDENKYEFMVDVLLAKFSQNSSLKKMLLDTCDAILVEASPKDKIWGIGMDVNHSNFNDQSKWDGLNLLGKALMEVRNILNNKW